MRAWTWAVVAASGFGLMGLAYSSRPRPDAGTPWAYGLIAVGAGEAAGGRLADGAIATRLRLLPGGDRVEAILAALGRSGSVGSADLPVQLRPKLILMPDSAVGIAAGSLQSGRLPTAGRREVLAGSKAPRGDRLTVGGRSLEVVGVLGPGVAVFADCYLLPASPTADDFFPAGDPSVRRAVLVRLDPGQRRDPRVLRRLEEDYPAPKFTLVLPDDRLGRGPYYLYLLGQALLLVGGSGALIGLYRWSSGRVGLPWLAAPLREIRARPRLVWAVHLVYFGLVILGAAAIFELPDVQAVLMSAVRGQIKGTGGGPLAVAGRAYGSGNIPRAAAVTFLINFLLGSVAVITLPSAVLPVAVVAAVRAVLWGVLLGPTSAALAFGMLPHSWTLLLEGEGYILAAFFGLLVPVHLLQSSLGGTVAGRFGRVLLLNLKACALVALVLAVAACYEAVEVIRMAG